MQAFDLLGTALQPNMTGLRKQNETPEFAGISSHNLNLVENELNLSSTLPTSAT